MRTGKVVINYNSFGDKPRKSHLLVSFVATNFSVSYLNSRSVTATNTGCHRSMSSVELSEEAPLPSQALLLPLLPPPPVTRLLSHPICRNSPINETSTRFASTNAACVVWPIAECNALNQTIASAGSVARKMHEWMPSGECSSIVRFSVKNWKKTKNLLNAC